MGAEGRRRAWRRWSGPRSRDIVIIVLCAINTLAGVWTEVQIFDHPAGALLVIIPGAIATVAMWWRRRHPVAVTGIAAACYLVSQVLLPMGFGLLTIAIQRRDRVLVAATVAVGICLTVPSPTAEPSSFGVSSVLAGVFGALFWALWGAYVGARRDLVSSLQDRAERAERERELRAEQARLAERSRIAREMHDVLAHKVSLIALQAGGLEVNPAVGPERVQQTAGLIRSTAREALEELRGVLGVLRDDDPSSPGMELAPQPGLAELPALVESSRAVGVRVSLTIDPLVVAAAPDTAGRTVYRVVQESLTNVHKHARGAATTVVITAAAAGDVVLTVTNQQPVGAGALLPGSGAGLIGLRERVVLLGGVLDARPTPDGGWRVHVRLPAKVRQDQVNGGRNGENAGAAWLGS